MCLDFHVSKTGDSVLMLYILALSSQAPFLLNEILRDHLIYNLIDAYGKGSGFKSESNDSDIKNLDCFSETIPKRSLLICT